ncbi:hypothetical protein P8452_19343 [Trifolium repens]|nr:hypothetical protein P8452_19343 [Trifolium repens]
MAAKFVVGDSFLSSMFQEINGRLATLRYFRNDVGKEVVRKIEITLSCINDVLDDAETKQYQNPQVKNWLDDLKHEVYELDQLLDLIDTTNPQRKGTTIRLFVSGTVLTARCYCSQCVVTVIYNASAWSNFPRKHETREKRLENNLCRPIISIFFGHEFLER